jgi:hypothetical protein
VQELVIVVADLYLPQASEAVRAEGIAVPGLEHVTRFATRSMLAHGWRPWLAHWLSEGATAATATTGDILSIPATAWMATPVHLVAGLTTLHLDRRGILRLPPLEQEQLSCGFQQLFHDSDFVLQSLDGGDFLLVGPEMTAGDGTEPARLVGESVADTMPAHAGSARLRKLGAEIEMWLHDHPVNRARASRGEPTVTALWFWGSGSPAFTSATTLSTAAAPAAAMAAFVAPATPPTSALPPATGSLLPSLVFGRDSALRGLCARIGAKALPLPQQLADVLGYPRAQRVVLVVEMSEMLHSNPRWTLLDTLARLDQAFITPALQLLREGELGHLHVLANDRHFALRSRDRLKFWRRQRLGLEGLQ